MPTEVATHGSGPAVLTRAVVMLATAVFLRAAVLVVIARLRGSLLVALGEGRGHGDALQRHHYDGQQEKELSEPGRRHVACAVMSLDYRTKAVFRADLRLPRVRFQSIVWLQPEGGCLIFRVGRGQRRMLRAAWKQLSICSV